MNSVNQKEFNHSNALQDLGIDVRLILDDTEAVFRAGSVARAMGFADPILPFIGMHERHFVVFRDDGASFKSSDVFITEAVVRDLYGRIVAEGRKCVNFDPWLVHQAVTSFCDELADERAKDY